MTPTSVDRIACPNCNAEVPVFTGESLLKRRIVTVCASCGHDTFYVQKDFNRRAGVTIVIAGIVLSIYFFSRGSPFYAMGALGATAMVDFLVYLLVGDVTVCYACHAIYRGFDRNPEHESFDLKKLEKYGGREPRHGAPHP